MRAKLFLLLIASLLMLSAQGDIWADGNDITLTGKVAIALIEDNTGNVYVLRPEHGDKLPEAVTAKVGENLSVYGNVYKKLNYKSFKVEEVR